MADRLPPPEKLDLSGDSTSVGIRWDKWKRSLELYLEAAEIEDPRKKRTALLVIGGIDLQEIFYNLPDSSSSDGVDIFQLAIRRLDSYFRPKQNRNYERHIFRLIKQETSESFERFIIRLREQAAKCRFNRMDEEIIGQIIEGGNSMDLRRKILAVGEDVTLDEIVAVANTMEIVNHQLNSYELLDKSNTSQVNAIYKRETFKYSNEGKSIKCNRCGNIAHRSSDPNCPAKQKECHSCGKLGHYQRCCRTKDYQQKRNAEKRKSEDVNKNNFKRAHGKSMVNSLEDEKVQYIFNMNDDASIKCLIGGVQLEMLIDSGCKLNLITDKTWEYLKNNKIECTRQVKDSDKTLLAYGSNIPLQIKGSFDAFIKTRNGNSEKSTIYVIKDGTRDLLGKDTAIRLGVLKLGASVNIVANNMIKPFPKFKGVLIDIPVDKSVKPVIQPHRRIPIPIEGEINNMIQELLDMDIIEEVHQPSEWVSPVVPILKDNGEVRLCVDMRRANAAILRENHPLPCMEHLLPKINKAQYFSKLDIRNAFHQLELHPDSRYITTFITTGGLYRYKRLMFGITCAPEIFQKTLERILIGCEGVINFIDDILIYGRTEQEHDCRLSKVMEVLKENNVLLNENKCVYKAQKIYFLGHELTPEGVRPLPKYVVLKL